MEFSGEKFARLSWRQRLRFGALVLGGSGLLIAGCSSANPNGANPADVKACAYSYKTVGNNMLRVTTTGEPQNSNAQITRVKVMENGSNQYRQFTAIGNSLTVQVVFGMEHINVYGVYGNFDPPQDQTARLQVALNPPLHAIARQCGQSGTI